MAGKKTDAPGTQATRRPGKKKTGWKKVGVYLTPEATKQLSLAVISRSADKSTIVSDLLVNFLPQYVLAHRVAPNVSAMSDGPLHGIEAQPN